MTSLRLLNMRTARRLPEIKGIWKDLMATAQVSLKIVGGELNSEFYEDEGILEELEAAIDRDVQVEIVHGPNVDPKTKRIFELEQENKVALYGLRDRPQSHFMVVDETTAEVESFHAPRAGDRQIFTKSDTLFLAQRLSIEFEKLKARA